MKRFWQDARAGGGAVLLDGRPLRLPGGDLWLNPALAAAIAAEWNGVEGEVRHDRLPLTQLSAATTRVAADPAPTVAALAAYAASDLLCYRAERPPSLAALQAAAWDPWLDWANRQYGARLATGAGITPVPQPPAALAALRAAAAAADPPRLAMLGAAVPALGSLVLGLALADGALTPVAAHALATFDERYQEGLWGEDAEAAARHAAIGAEIAAAARFLALARA